MRTVDEDGNEAPNDEKGLLCMIARKKDVVITGAENVYTIEVEAAICENPDGRPDRKMRLARRQKVSTTPDYRHP